MELCPKEYKTSEGCQSLFCQYKDKVGKCSLDFEIEDREYSVGEIAEIFQVSRQRVWRIYELLIHKIKDQYDNKGYNK